jgi:hypothetical protein
MGANRPGMRIRPVIGQKGDDLSLRSKLQEEFETLCCQACSEKGDADEIPARVCEAGHQAFGNRSPPSTDTMGISDVFCLAVIAVRSPPPVRMTSTLRSTNSSASAVRRSLSLSP